MIANKIKISNIPIIVWGEEPEKVYIFVHGKMSSKESAETFAETAGGKGYQTISFDLPQHGEQLENTYHTCNIKKCLFQSPILDMEYLIKQMMVWFDISEERLAQEKEMDTPIDIVTWDYYQYVKVHPIQKWDVSTNILLVGKIIFNH